jgi:hypothetical protein
VQALILIRYECRRWQAAPHARPDVWCAGVCGCVCVKMSYTHLDQVVEYMRECKLQLENVKIPLIVTGETDHVSSIFVKVFKVEKGTPGRTWSSLSSTNKVEDNKVGDYVPAGTTRQATKGQAAQLLPMETRWTPAGVNRTFPILHVSGTGLIPSCRSPLLYIHHPCSLPPPSSLSLILSSSSFPVYCPSTKIP